MKKFFNVKTVSLILAVILLVGGAVGGTLAWIVAESGTVTNTFTYGDIDIKLEETDFDNDGDATNNKYPMIPGNSIDKDPTVTALKDSEACWLFVKLEKTGGATIDNTTYTFDHYLTYEMADGWTELSGETGVYYRQVDKTTDDTAFAVIKDNKVNVKGTVTKAMLNALDSDSANPTYPTLKVTAFAVQRDDNINSAQDAWTVATTGDLPTIP